MKNITINYRCPICKEGFPSKKSMTNHKRWHNLLEYKSFQENFKKNIGKKLRGKKHTKETIEKIRKKRKGKCLGKDNPNWKGDNVGYHCLHTYIRRHKPKPEACEKCGKIQDYLELANISGEYKRKIDDYIYLCVKCHKEMDGTLQPFIEGGEKTRFQKGMNPWNKGIPRSEETKQKISISLLKEKR